MRYIVTIPAFLFVYWCLISDKGFGGLMALFASPFVLFAWIGLELFIRSKNEITSKFHSIDFMLPAVFLVGIALFTPSIK